MSSSPLYKQVLKGIALALLAMIQPVSADDEFNLRILEMDTPLENTSTLKNFINDNGLLPGNFLTTIMWDRDVLDKRTVSWILSDDKQRLLPELTKADLRALGVKVDTIPDMKDLDDAVIIDDISHFIDNARYDYDQIIRPSSWLSRKNTAIRLRPGLSSLNSGMTVLPPPGQATSLAALSSTTVLVKRHLHGLVWSRGSTSGRGGCVTTAPGVTTPVGMQSPVRCNVISKPCKASLR